MYYARVIAYDAMYNYTIVCVRIVMHFIIHTFFLITVLSILAPAPLYSTHPYWCWYGQSRDTVQLSNKQ